MNQKLKLIIKKILPELVIFKLRTIFSRLKIIKCKKIFEHAPETPIWLGWDILKKLQQKYPFPPEYNYAPQDFERRGEERAREILSLIRTKTGKTKKINTFLELGCLDGITCCVLQKKGKRTTAIDIISERFDERAMREGVIFVQMDATHLGFEDESFDFVFSYAAFEHFAEPESVLQEAMRVAKTGGYIYLVFGPLYMSPMGLHAYRSISVPYCQFLFPKELLQDFANTMRLGTIDFDSVNGWSLDQYRKIWKRYSHRLEKVIYYERYDISHLDLIMKYPSCFKSKTKYFDNLIVSSIEVLFKKIK